MAWQEVRRKEVSMSRRSQRQAILEYLERGGRLTHLDALYQFGCARLAARIHELREAGYPIMSRVVKLPSGKTIVEYYMKKDGPNGGE